MCTCPPVRLVARHADQQGQDAKHNGGEEGDACIEAAIGVALPFRALPGDCKASAADAQRHQGVACKTDDRFKCAIPTAG